jgi:hypothetical protein
MYSAPRLWASSRRPTFYHLDDGFRGFTSHSAENSLAETFQFVRCVRDTGWMRPHNLDYFCR